MKKKIKLRGSLKTLMRWPLYLGLIVAAADAAAFAVDIRAGLIVLAFLAAYCVAAVLLDVYLRPGILDDMVRFASDFSKVQQNMVRDMEIPYTLLDETGKILWVNRQMEILLKGHPGVKNIASLFPEARPSQIRQSNKAIFHLKYEDRDYKAVVSGVDIDDFISANKMAGTNRDGYNVFALYLFDETEMLKTRREISSQRLVCGLIYVDNYEEALGSTEEVRRSLLAALVERKITKYLQNFDAIVDKIEKDKYIFVMKQKFLPRMQDARFPLLDDVREINIGNELSVTLSIGIGTNAETYAQAQEWARHAIDLALGRGGDQAVVKDRDKMSYYGGKTKQVEKSTRVRARVKAHALRQVIQGKDKVVVMGHRLGDVDCVGAGIGVYRAARVLNKEAHIVLNDVSTSVRPIIEHFLDNPKYSSDMFMTSEEAAKIVDNNTALVVVDVSTADRVEAPSLFDLTRTVVVIDHHRQSGNSIENPVLSYIEPYASSACEMVTEILQYIADGIKLKPEEADALYAGIIIDTNNFLNETGVRTFEAAAYLRRSGADVNRVRVKLRDDMKTFKARAEAVKDAVIDGRYAYAVCPSEGLASPQVVGAQVANELLNIRGIEAAFVFTKVKDTVFISARSLETMNVQLVMERLGGGGHTTIAGAQLVDVREAEAMERVRNAVKSMKEKGEL